MWQLAKCDTSELMLNFDAWKYKYGVKSLLPVQCLCHELSDLLTKTLQLPVRTSFRYQLSRAAVIHCFIRCVSLTDRKINTEPRLISHLSQSCRRPVLWQPNLINQDYIVFIGSFAVIIPWVCQTASTSPRGLCVWWVDVYNFTVRSFNMA